jgi:hypothetical protein
MRGLGCARVLKHLKKSFSAHVLVQTRGTWTHPWRTWEIEGDLWYSGYSRGYSLKLA